MTFNILIKSSLGTLDNVSTVLYEEISVCLCLIQNIESYELKTVRREKGSNHKPSSVFRVLLS